MHPKFLPFSLNQLREHFTADADKNIDYFENSARRYEEFLAENQVTEGIPLTKARGARQIEKDERFWTACSLKTVFDSPKRDEVLRKLLFGAFGDEPPLEGISSWEECLEGDLRLFFEAQLPSPTSYATWLRANLHERHMIPYVLDAARGKSHRPLEGPTHVDAILVNPDNGFSLLIEAKVLSDISATVSFDLFRNQLARNIDVMMESHPRLQEPLCRRDPDRSLIALLTPKAFRDHPKTRLYGWLFEEYRTSPEALERDLPHRRRDDWATVSTRIGWICFEDVEAELPGTCPWLPI